MEGIPKSNPDVGQNKEGDGSENHEFLDWQEYKVHAGDGKKQN